MSDHNQRLLVQAEIGVARDLIDQVEMALIGEYDSHRSREVLLYSRVALTRAVTSIGAAQVRLGEALDRLDAEEENGGTANGTTAGKPVVPRQKTPGDRVPARPASAV